MSGLVVDTSSWVSYFAGRPSAEIESALAEARVLLSPVVAAELLSGVMSARQRASLEDLLGDLPLCETHLQHWFRVGALRRALRSRGLTVSTPDAHVAQCAVDAGARLLSEDGIFARIARHSVLKLA